MFEYLIIEKSDFVSCGYIDRLAMEDELNEVGKLRWELVSVDDNFIYLKRAKVS